MNLQKSVKVSAAITDTNINDLAKGLGITRVWLWKKLSENNPKYISKIAEFYDIEVSELIRRGEQ